MTLRQLLYFVAVAEELHFGRAAQRLHVSQPPLSARVAELEAEVGFRLLDRSSRHVALTEEGTHFLRQARKVLAAMTDLERLVERQSPGRSRPLRLAVPPDTSARVLEDVTVQVHTEHGNVNLEVQEATTGEQHARLHQGHLDVALLRHPFPTKGLLVGPRLTKALGVLLAADHPLTKQAQVRLRDLSGQTLVMFRREISPWLYDETLRTCAEAGYRPSKIEHATRIVDGLLLTDRAVAFRGQHAANNHKRLAWRPIEREPLCWTTSVVWCRGSTSPLLKYLGHALWNALQTHDRWIPA